LKLNSAGLLPNLSDAANI